MYNHSLPPTRKSTWLASSYIPVSLLFPPPSSSPHGACVQVVGRLKDMGFSEAAARKALEDSNWDQTAAVNALLSS